MTMYVLTVLARSGAAATIYFIAQFCTASIRERRLFNEVSRGPAGSPILQYTD